MLDVLAQQFEHWQVKILLERQTKCQSLYVSTAKFCSHGSYENNPYKLPSQARLHWSAVFDPIDIDWMIRLAPNPLRHIRTCSYGSRSEANLVDDIVEIAPVNPTSITEVYLMCRNFRDTLCIILIILWWSLHRTAGTSATIRLFREFHESECRSSIVFLLNLVLSITLPSDLLRMRQ